MTKKISESAAMGIVEDVVGCKWALRVIHQIHSGCRRPGQLRRRIPGISAKVLNERLVKLTRFGILRKKIYPVSPPKVEYTFTAFGKKFLKVIAAIRRLSDPGRNGS